MSQAENSNMPSREFESSPIQPTVPSSPESTAEPAPPLPDHDWETVTFPHSLNVDTLSQTDDTVPRRPLVLPLATTPVSLNSPMPVNLPGSASVVLPDLSFANAVAAPTVGAVPVADMPAMTLEPSSITPSAELVDSGVALFSVASEAPTPDDRGLQLAPENAQLRQQIAELEQTLEQSSLQLTQENTQLRQQIAELEQSLEQAQQVLVTSTDRWQAKMLEQAAEFTQKLNQQATKMLEQAAQHSQAQATAQTQIAQQTQAIQQLTEQEKIAAQSLATTQDRTTQMFQELEQAHQTTQRQQILLETLTNQIATSQERIGQLERECAIAQQRYTDQLQVALQAESACKDLRSRLNRQQRHTLQFKAALEKCLEVPATQGLAHLALTQQADAELVSTTEAGRTVPPVFIPKAQPVQPWTAHPGFLTPEYRPIEIARWGAPPPASQPEVIVEVDPPTEPPIAASIAPKVGADRTITAIELPPMVKVGPYPGPVILATPSLEADSGAAFDESTRSVVPIENLADIDLWAVEDPLTDVIDPLDAKVLRCPIVPPPAANTNTPEGAIESNWHSLTPIDDSAIPPEFPQDLAVVATADADLTADQPPAPAVEMSLSIVKSSEVRDESPHYAPPQVSPFMPVETVAPHQPTASADPTWVPMEAPSPAMLFHANGPSPIVYPLRPARKLASLAAVQLPSFPPSGNPA